MLCPAAMSHSIVGVLRGYKSAFPSAKTQNFILEPKLFWLAGFTKSIQLSKSLFLWFKLAIIVNFFRFTSEQWMFFAWSKFWFFSNFHAFLLKLNQIVPVYGWAIKPKKGVWSLIKAKFTVKLGDPLINSLVPSMGSISQKILSLLNCSCDFSNSSETIINLGNIFWISETAIWLTAISPSVTGEKSFL